MSRDHGALRWVATAAELEARASNVQASAANGTVHVTWSTPDDHGTPIIGYRISRRPEGGVAEQIAGVSADVRSYDDTPPANVAFTPSDGRQIVIERWDDRGEALKAATLLVNATSLGMKGQPPLEIDLSHLPHTAAVCDIVYIPLETALLATARACGNRCIDGLGMLLHQGRPGFEAWFGVKVDVSPEQRRAVAADLGA